MVHQLYVFVLLGITLGHCFISLTFGFFRIHVFRLVSFLRTYFHFKGFSFGFEIQVKPLVLSGSVLVPCVGLFRFLLFQDI